jgi:nitrous oxide reductase accessory protein NosL
MKNKLLVSVIVSAILLLSGSMLFAQDDIQKHGSCSYCGMNRGNFAHSRMLIIYDDSTEFGACSLHCAAVDLAVNLDKTPKSIQVGDYNTKKLIDAEQASWVIGGNKPGVMTKRGKWAFENKADAETFVKANGGTIATFDEAIKATYEDMYADTKMIRDKRKMMKQKKMGHQM